MRWLGELARAVDEAQQVIWRLNLLQGDNVRLSEIYGRLEAARDEIGRLQRHARRQAKLKLDQEWSELIATVSSCAGALD